MKKKIIWLVVSCLMVAALVLASCGPAEVVEEEEEVVAEEEEEVVEEEEAPPEEEVTPPPEKPRYGGVIILTWEPTSVSAEEIVWYDPVEEGTTYFSYMVPIYAELGIHISDKYFWEIDNPWSVKVNEDGTVSTQSLEGWHWKIEQGDPRICQDFVAPHSGYYFLLHSIGRPQFQILTPKLTSRREIDLTDYKGWEAKLDYTIKLSNYGIILPLISTDSGESWTLVSEGEAVFGADKKPYHLTFDVSEFTGNKIMLRFQPREFRGWGSCGAIDDIRITVHPGEAGR